MFFASPLHQGQVLKEKNLFISCVTCMFLCYRNQSNTIDSNTIEI